MSDFAATPETGPVDAPASMASVLAEFTSEAPPKDDPIKGVVDELVKETEDDGHAEAPVTEESATDPIEQDAEAEEAPPEAETDADEPKYSVKVNGQDMEVPLSELLKGYSRTEDYKAKTMALADERRADEAKRGNIEAEVRGQYATELKQQVELFEALDPVLTQARQIDWEALKRTDPATFVQFSEQVQERLQLVGQARERVQAIAAEEQARRAQSVEAERAQRLDLTAERLAKAMPELADEAKLGTFASENIGYLREIGFTPAELNDMVDDRVLLAAHKARQWDELQKAKAALPEKKIVPRSAVQTAKTDATEKSRAPAARIRPGMSRDDKLSLVLQEFAQDT